MAKNIKKSENKLRRGTKRLSKQLCGKKSLTLKHSYDNSFSVFRTAKESHPLITVTASGEYKISVFKLLLILFGTVSALAIMLMIAKRIRNRRRARMDMAEFEEYADYEDEELPF